MNDINVLEHQPIAWTPTPEVIERAQLTKFMKQVGVSTFDELYAYSIRDVEKFTEEVLKFLDIKFDPPYTKLLDTSNGPEFPNWLAANPNSASAVQAETRPVGSVPHAGLNITTMCLDRWQTDAMKDQPAVIWEGEEGESEILPYWALLDNVDVCVQALKQLGVRQGDAVGIHLPMLPETVVALLSINRIGAIAVPVFSGYGVEAIVSRMDAVGARALFTSDWFPRRGKPFDMLAVAANAVSKLDAIEGVIVVERRVRSTQYRIPDLTDNESTTKLKYDAEFEQRIEDLEARFNGKKVKIWGVDRTLESFLVDDSEPAPTSAEDPLIILYTSGTTGKPKGIAHTHASFPIKAAQDMAFGTDVGRGTRICWYTDIGWMMGPWLIYGALINGATICLYDGAPDYPTPDRMWEFCARHKVEILGIAPTLVRSLAAQSEPPASAGGRDSSNDNVAENPGTNANGRTGDDAALPLGAVPPAHAGGSDLPHYARHDLSSLRAFASSGEPWNPAPWWWLFEKVGNSKLPIINYSGGTEISGGILMGNPLLPQKPCSFPAPCPGMDVDILDENGRPVGPNQVGELVIKQPWIGMARGFWRERERYLETYWNRFSGIWVHGDWAMRDSDGHWFILGRSDDTLKVAGKRVGPAEVESLLVAHPIVAEAAVIGVPDEVKGTRMVAFCVLSAGNSPQSRGNAEKEAETRPVGSVPLYEHELEAELKSLVARDMGKPLAPSKIHFVSTLPKTRNAKVMRRVIRAAYLGEDAGDLSALENPQAVEELRGLNEEKPAS
jgi:acetyl-CoA synthetase